MLNYLIRGLTGLTASALVSAALADPVPEIGDAGDLPASSQILPSLGTITSISGSIGSASDVDMYRFTVPSAMSLSFIVAASSTIDSQLFLFNSLGAGVWANDDVGTSLDAQITAPLAAGLYYLAISSWDRHPVNASNLPIFGSDGGVLLPPINSGAVTAWTGSGGIGMYSINVSAVPEPETWALFCAGLLATIGCRRSKKQSKARSRPGTTKC